MEPEQQETFCRPTERPVYQDPAQPYGAAEDFAAQQPGGQPGPYIHQQLPPELQRKAARSFLRSAGNHAALMPILMNLIGVLLLIPAFFIWGIAQAKTLIPYYRSGGTKGVMQYLSSRQDIILGLTILCTILGVVCTVLIARPVLRRKIFTAWKKPLWSAPGFGKCLVLTFGIAAGGELLAFGWEQLSRLTGWKMTEPNFALTGNKTVDFIMMAYVCVLAPLMEETLFRGMILPSLRPWGDRLAVVVSAAMFGLAHMNLIQGIPAFCMGLLFARMTLSCGSIVPSALTHILNNTLSMVMLAAGIDSNAALQTGYLVFLAAAAAGSILLLALRRVDFHKPSPTDVAPAPAVEHPYRVVFLQSAAFWVTAALFFVMSFALLNTSGVLK